VYPNPARDFLVIQLPGVKQGEIEVSLYDNLGIRQMVKEIRHEEGQVSFGLPTLPPGLYTVRLKSPVISAAQKIILR
jgi:hypothetical protein